MRNFPADRSSDRRRFLGLTAGAVAGLGLASRGGWAAEPFVSDAATTAEASPGIYRPKVSLAAYSFRDQLTGKKTPPMTLTGFIDYCAAQGLEGTELTGYYLPEPITPASLRAIKRHAFQAGVTISGTATRNDFGVADPAKLKQEITHLKSWCDYAAEMGAPVIRIFAGHIPKGADEAATLRQIAESIAECCDYAGERGIFLALENHGGPTATADGLLAICDKIDSAWFGINLDTGNFRTPDPYADIAKVVPRSVNVQIKLAVTPVGPDGKPGRETADLDRVAKLLRAGGYNGFVVLEYEEPGNPYEEIPTALTTLRKALESAA